MPLRVKLFPRAESDLARQYEWYSEHADADVADKYLRAFDDSVSALASFPGLGSTRKFKASRLSGIQSYAVKSPFDVHLIFYRTDATTLNILRVMHGARDLPRRL